jgi:hypothetical protein
MASLWVDGGDDPVGRDPTKDAEAPVRVLLDVLAGDGGKQRRRLGPATLQPLAPQGKAGAASVADQRVHQLLAGGPILPVAGQLAQRGAVVVALQQAVNLAAGVAGRPAAAPGSRRAAS